MYRGSRLISYLSQKCVLDNLFYNLGSITKFLQLTFKLESTSNYISGKETKFDHIFYDNIRDTTLRVMTLIEFLVEEVEKMVLDLNFYDNKQVILSGIILSGIYCI